MMEEHERNRSNMLQQQQSDSVEIITLRKACQLQKRDIENLENSVKNLQDEVHHNRLEADEKLNEKMKQFDTERKELVDHYHEEIQKQEEMFIEERTKIKVRIVAISYGRKSCSSSLLSICRNSAITWRELFKQEKLQYRSRIAVFLQFFWLGNDRFYLQLNTACSGNGL